MKSFNFLFIIMAINLLASTEKNLQKESFTEPTQQFRAVWSSPWGGDSDLITYISKEDFIKNMTYILDTLQMYNMNSVIYHVRMHDDALYKSKYNPVSPYWSEVDFNDFDPLEWMINLDQNKTYISF